MSEKYVKRIIFLDIDGVLNSVHRASGLGQKAYSAAGLDPVAINLLKELSRKTEASIVISSTWGKSIGTSPEWWVGLFAAFGWEYPQASVIGITPRCSGTRGDAIREWIRLYDIERGGLGRDFRYVCLDDDTDLYPDQNLIQTNSWFGLTSKHVDKAIEILGIAEVSTNGPSDWPVTDSIVTDTHGGLPKGRS